MGLGIVLLFWAVIGAILTGIGMVAFGVATAFFTRGVARHRRRAITIASLFPLACFGWAGAVFVFQAVVNEGYLHRDLGIGDTWHCPLPNGYQIVMIDLNDQGSVYNAKEEGVVYDVRTLQVSGPYVLGGKDSQGFEHRGTDSNQVDSYFLLNTQTGEEKTLRDYDALRDAALQLKIQPNLEPIDVVYSRYRFSWFDVFAGILFCVPPIIGFLLLVRWIFRLRRTRSVATQPV